MIHGDPKADEQEEERIESEGVILLGTERLEDHGERHRDAISWKLEGWI